MSTDRVFNVLFFCTGNSARSILAESAMTKLGQGRFRAFVMALNYLESRIHCSSRCRSTSSKPQR